MIQAYIIDNVELNYDRCPEIQNQKEIKQSIMFEITRLYRLSVEF